MTDFIDRYTLVSTFIPPETLVNISEEGINCLYTRIMRRIRKRLESILYVDSVADLSDYEVARILTTRTLDV